MRNFQTVVKGFLRAVKQPVICAVYAAVITSTGSAEEVSIEKVNYKGWSNAYKMTNGTVELIAVADVGPRILHFGMVGKENILYVDPNTAGATGGDEWKGYGGHRLWIAPEHEVLTYYPDNFPVKSDVDGNTLTLTALPEIHDEDLRQEVTSFEELNSRMDDEGFKSKLGIQKKMIITMQENGRVKVEHEMRMHSKTQEAAPWALTVMNQNGLTVIPNAPYAPHGPGHFLPVRNLVLWSYTKLNDPRLTFMDEYTTIRQNPNADSPFKIGFSETQTWAGYALGDQFFVKHLDQKEDAIYPDMNSSVEIFTNASIMEIESLGVLVDLGPGDTMRHLEEWEIHEIEPIENVEAQVDAMVKTVGLD